MRPSGARCGKGRRGVRPTSLNTITGACPAVIRYGAETSVTLYTRTDNDIVRALGAA